MLRSQQVCLLTDWVIKYTLYNRNCPVNDIVLLMEKPKFNSFVVCEAG